MTSKAFAILLVVLILCGCKSTTHQSDRHLYAEMQALNVQLDAAERRHNLKEVNRLQDEIDKRGYERAKLEGLWR